MDTDRGELCLPQNKLWHLRELFNGWGDCKACTCRDLESLIGLLNHACKVMRVGLSFLRRMIDLLHDVHRRSSSKTPIRLNQGFRADLAWCHQFWYNGMGCHPDTSIFPSEGAPIQQCLWIMELCSLAWK